MRLAFVRFWTGLAVCLVVGAGPLPVAAFQAAPAGKSNSSAADERRFADIKARHDRGEPVTQEEREFAQRFMQRQNQQKAAQRFQEYAREHPPRESTGLVPLSDLGKQGYQGEPGGLYPGGNAVPAAHLKPGLKLARAIAPLDLEGRPAPHGKIVLLSIGMSNTTQEFHAFQQLAAGDRDINPRLAIVDGAQGGQAADTTANPKAKFWDIVDQRLKESGVSPKQVQAVWLKQAIIRPTHPFPADAKMLEGYIIDTLHNLHDKFPNLKIAYLSSRIYAGYAVTPLNPEPHAYESAFSVKWAITEQIDGKPALNYDPARGEVQSPWIAWGPYLWGDGVKGRRDGLVWLREDLGPDGTHPSDLGRKKVAQLLLQFFKNDPISRPWFARGN